MLFIFDENTPTKLTQGIRILEEGNNHSPNPHPISQTIDIEAFFEKHTRGPIFRS